ncbi:MAG: sulfotransferase family protein, partial [Dolichospermum sp.]
LQNREGVKYLHLPESQRSNKIRFLEKTPKNALRIPFIKAIFPDALFIYLYREPKGNISSLMEGWRSQRFISYQSLPGWPYRNWSFLLVPEWLSLQKSSLVEIAAYQWKKANYYLIQDLKTLPSSCWHLVNYQDLIEQPQQTINSIAEFTQLHQDQQVVEMLFRPLAIAQRTLSSPSAEKWRKNARELATVLPDLEDLINILENRKTQI